MGIPKFYRWLSERYPLINEAVVKGRSPEFDCLYLDMNGIIHNCTHPEELDVTKARLTEEKMFTRIFEYIDRIFHLINPRHLLFMAVDGVAPRAKMNQQRQRRFKSAKEMREHIEMAKSSGQHVEQEDPFDSNCITPGTNFMAKLCKHLRFFVRSRMQVDSAWRRVRVILSGSDVPGEGEHKIMLYIRRMKMKPRYPSNLRHCLYGLDADLIMLGLVSHEPHFALLREQVVFGNKNKKRRSIKNSEVFQLLHLSLLREYLEIEFKGITILNVDSTARKSSASSKSMEAVSQENKTDIEVPGAKSAPEKSGSSTPVVQGIRVDLERVIDDFVFLCFFVGNDFLPNLPMLDIAVNSLDQILEMYKSKILPRYGYVTNAGTVNPTPAQALLNCLAEIQSPILQQRFADEKWFSSKRKRKSNSNDKSHSEGNKATDEKKFEEALLLAQIGEDILQEKGGLFFRKNITYYQKKFPEFFKDAVSGRMREAKESCHELKTLCQKYWEGLNWVLQYYYQGCASWGWYFPYHYAPMSAELASALPKDFETPKFILGEPYRPLEQLLSVLPPDSKQFLPDSYRVLVEKGSPIKEWYPESFKEDQNFKKAPWEAIALIPFIDGKRLLETIKSAHCEEKLSTEENKRNCRNGQSFLYQCSGANLVNLSKLSTGKIGAAGSTVKSTLPSLFPDINRAISEELLWDFPPKDKPFVPKVPRKYNRPAPGYPCISWLKPVPNLELANVNIFGFESKKPTLVLKLHPVSFPPKKLASHFFGKKTRYAYIGWPQLRESVVVAVEDRSCTFTRSGKHTKSLAEQEDFRKRAAWFENHFKSKKGILLGEVAIIFRVLPFLKCVRDESGNVVKRYSRNPEDHPAQTVLLKNPAPDPRWEPHDALPMQKEYPRGSAIVYLGGDNFYGSMGKIEKLLEDIKKDLVPGEKEINRKSSRGEAASVTLFSTNLANPTGFRKLLAAERKLLASDPEFRYFPEKDVAKALQLSTRVLSQVADSVIFSPGRTNIGLSLRCQKEREMVPGWTRWRKGWEYSSRAVQVLAEFKKTFPRLIALLSKGYRHVYSAEDLIERSGFVRVTREQGLAELAKMTAWSKSRGLASLHSCPSTSEILPERTVKLIAALIEKNTETKRVTMTKMDAVHRNLLYRANPEPPWTPSVKFGAGDRVLSLRSDEGVPFGALGTVIAVHRMSREEAASPLICDVLLDNPVAAAGTLLGRCPEAKGVSLPATSLLNLSHRPRNESTTSLAGEKSALETKQTPSIAFKILKADEKKKKK